MHVISLRCHLSTCNRRWATLYNGVFSAIAWDPDRRRATNHAIAITSLVEILQKHTEDHKPTFLVDSRDGEDIRWARIENNTISITSRHGGHAHTNHIAINALYALLRGTGHKTPVILANISMVEKRHHD